MGNISIEGSGWIMLGLAVAYLFPTIVALVRRQSITVVILVNLFLGWTAIGWIIALWLAKATDKPAMDCVNALPNIESARKTTRTFDIPEDLHERASDLAVRLGVPVAEIGCRAIIEFLDREQSHELPKDAGKMGSEL